MVSRDFKFSFDFTHTKKAYNLIIFQSLRYEIFLQYEVSVKYFYNTKFIEISVINMYLITKNM